MITIVCMLLDAIYGDKFKPDILYVGCMIVDVLIAFSIFLD